MSDQENYNFSLKDVRRLFDIVQNNPKAGRDWVERSFNQNASNFDSVLEFMGRMGIFVLRDMQIVLNPSYEPAIDDKTLVQIIKTSILRSASGDIKKLLNKFDAGDSSFVYAPAHEDRFEFGQARNLLIEAGIIHQEKEQHSYYIEPLDYADYVNSASQEPKPMTLRSFKKILKAQEEIGEAAEMAVISYELERIGGKPSDVYHTSQHDVGAGYDVESRESASDTRGRYIEVKAVSRVDYGFHWSQNELEVAKKLGDRYFLYLVPIVEGRPSVGDLIIHVNPYRNLLADDDWAHQPDGLSVYLQAPNRLDRNA